MSCFYIEFDNNNTATRIIIPNNETVNSAIELGFNTNAGGFNYIKMCVNSGGNPTFVKMFFQTAIGDGDYLQGNLTNNNNKYTSSSETIMYLHLFSFETPT